MHAMATGLAAAVHEGRCRASATTRRSSRILRDGPRRGDRGRARCRVGERRAARRRRRRVQRRPARRLPHAARRRRRAACRAPRHVLAALPAVGRRRARAGRRPSAAHHNIHFGARLGRLLPGAHPRRRAHARPVDPRHPALARRPVPGAGRLHAALRARAGAQPRRPRRLAPRARADRSPSCAQRVACARLPDRRRGRAHLDPLDWQALGMERGTPFALAHTFRQTGPFRPTNVDRRVPGLVFVGSSTVPGVGVPMVLVSGKLAARAGRPTYAGRRRRDRRCSARHARGQLRRCRG